MSLFDSARFRMSVSQLQGLPTGDVPEIAFAGRSNAGKSTTINVLTRQGRLAFASKTPGRTQLINFFDLSEKDEHGHRQRVASLVDLPGYGFAKAAEQTGARVADISSLTIEDPENFAKDEPNYPGDRSVWRVEGIGMHPGDKGMENIARILFENIDL